MQDIENIFGEAFNPQTVPVNENSSPIPPGLYDAECVMAEVRTTRSGTGQFLALDFRVSDGDCIGRHVFGNINLANQNQKAVEIGLRDLASLARAAGLAVVKSSSEFLGRKVSLRVALRKDDASRNEIKGYLPPHSGGTVAAPSRAPSAPSVKAAPETKSSPGVKPWLRNRPAAAAAPQGAEEGAVENLPF